MTKRHQFKGFDDPVEIFRAGTHTDSQGRSGTWTEADLDEMVRNHNESTAAPAVIGHPETDDPAYGWVERLERRGQSLFAKFKDVVPQFAEAVEKGRYRKRSVSVGKTPDGWRLLHVGWLGAKAPALDLAPMNYSTSDVREAFEFEADWLTPGTIARAMRRLREFLIEQFGLDAADRVMPGGDIDFLDEHADDLRTRERERISSESDAAPAFAKFENPNGDDAVKNFSQADLDQAREDAKAEARREYEQQETTLQQQLEQERAARHKAEFSAELDKLQDEGKLTPAQAAGALEFMQSLAASPSSFEFAAPDGKSTSKTEPLAWFRQFMQSLPKQVDIGPGNKGADADTTDHRLSNFAAPTGSVVDGDRLSVHERALQYAKANKVPYIDAVMAIEQES
jgi:hypothetical protein